MNRIFLKSGDIGIRLTDTLLKDGVPMDLTGATVKFIMKGRTGAAFVDDALFEESGQGPGEVAYEIGIGFPTTSGVYQQEWEVTLAGSVLTFPSDSYNEIQILDDLN